MPPSAAETGTEPAVEPAPALADGARCPCLSGEVYGECCGPLHRGTAKAPTAERLMRSRYSAFAVGDGDYLRATWHPSTRPAALELDPGIRWLSLEIVDREQGGPFDTQGVVEFVGRYRATNVDGTIERGEQHERSTFAKTEGRWFYVGQA